MTRHGPWLPSPGQQVTVDPGTGAARSNYVSGGTPLDFPATCEPPSVVGPSDPPDTLVISHVSDGVSDTYTLSQIAIDFTPLLSLNDGLDWAPTVPPRAVGWEYDPAFTTPDQWVDGFTVAVSVVDDGDDGTGTSATVTVDLQPILPADLTYSTGLAPDLPLPQPVPGADLTSPIGSATLSPTDTGATIVSSLFDAAYAHNLTLPNGPTTAVRVIAYYSNQHTHVPPAANSGRVVHFPAHTLTVYWTPPRYRFLYDALPPLRQYPRDDALGGAPRNGKASTSTQHSARQGWKAAYR